MLSKGSVGVRILVVAAVAFALAAPASAAETDALVGSCPSATYEQPFQYPEGIEVVVVNGQIVLEHGKPTGAKPGRAIRRTP